MKTYLIHHGILGQKWGVRRFQNKDGSLTSKGKQKESLSKEEKLIRQKSITKTAGLLVGGAAVGAAAVGAAWYLKNQHGKKILRQKRLASTAKGQATRAARKAEGYYETFKNVDVTISKGADFVKSFSNVRIARILA